MSSPIAHSSQRSRLTEVVYQTDIVPFHNDACGNEQAPADGLGIQLDALEQRHLVLLLRRDLGIVDDSVHGLEVIDPIRALLVDGGDVADCPFRRHERRLRSCEGRRIV